MISLIKEGANVMSYPRLLKANRKTVDFTYYYMYKNYDI